jgi:hypothetical protein
LRLLLFWGWFVATDAHSERRCSWNVRVPPAIQRLNIIGLAALCG